MGKLIYSAITSLDGFVEDVVGERIVAPWCLSASDPPTAASDCLTPELKSRFGRLAPWCRSRQLGIRKRPGRKRPAPGGRGHPGSCELRIWVLAEAIGSDVPLTSLWIWPHFPFSAGGPGITVVAGKGCST